MSSIFFFLFLCFLSFLLFPPISFYPSQLSLRPSVFLRNPSLPSPLISFPFPFSSTSLFVFFLLTSLRSLCHFSSPFPFSSFSFISGSHSWFVVSHLIFCASFLQSPQEDDGRSHSNRYCFCCLCICSDQDSGIVRCLAFIWCRMSSQIVLAPSPSYQPFSLPPSPLPSVPP